ncbi:MAG: hypothetical protein ACE5JK_06940 [Candidatus Omnitrophota bacterium]
MSIISEALKKAQARRLFKKGKNNPDTTPSPETNPEQYLDEMVKAEKERKTETRKVGRAISVALVLFIVLVLGGTTYFLLTAKTKAPPKPTPRAVPSPKKTVTRRTPPVKPQAVKPAVSAPVEEEIPVEEKPTVKKPVEVKEYQRVYVATPDLPILSGIMYSPTNPQAIIDGELYTEGETVRGYKIKKILLDKVKITSGEKEFELRLR